MAEIFLTRGDARDLDILMQEPDETPINIVGWSAEFALCRNIIGEAPKIAWNTSDNADKFDIGIVDPTHVIVHLDDDDTTLLPYGWYAWDLRLTDPSGDSVQPISGYLYVSDTQLGGVTPP